jgi:hypothetical protein
LGTAVQLKFLHRLEGPVWNLLANKDILLIEVRTKEPQRVTFSALDLHNDVFLWRDKVLEETWWVNASAICSGIVLFTIYMDTNNPDKKGILAYSIHDLQLKWWKNDFSISELGENSVKGFASKFGLKEVIFDVHSGEPMDAESFVAKAPASSLQKPVQYSAGQDHFTTVQTFLADRLNFPAVSSLEYLECGKCVIISCYSVEDGGLANYLFVLSVEGNVLLKEKLDGSLKGIGLDTFFILDGCVIFVRNRTELISYNII